MIMEPFGSGSSTSVTRVFLGLSVGWMIEDGFVVVAFLDDSVRDSRGYWTW